MLRRAFVFLNTAELVSPRHSWQGQSQPRRNPQPYHQQRRELDPASNTIPSRE